MKLFKICFAQNYSYLVKLYDIFNLGAWFVKKIKIQSWKGQTFLGLMQLQ